MWYKTPQFPLPISNFGRWYPLKGKSAIYVMIFKGAKFECHFVWAIFFLSWKSKKCPLLIGSNPEPPVLKVRYMSLMQILKLQIEIEVSYIASKHTMIIRHSHVTMSNIFKSKLCHSNVWIWFNWIWNPQPSDVNIIYAITIYKIVLVSISAPGIGPVCFVAYFLVLSTLK